MIKDKLQKLAFKKPKEEVCAFIFIEDGEFKILEVANKAENKESEFYIPAKTFLYAKEDHEIVAVFHSHPSGSENLSKYDISCSEASCMTFIVFSNNSRKFSVHVPEFLDTKEEYINQIKEELL